MTSEPHFHLRSHNLQVLILRHFFLKLYLCYVGTIGISTRPNAGLSSDEGAKYSFLLSLFLPLSTLSPLRSAFTS